jgi:hypothetical protein
MIAAVWGRDMRKAVVAAGMTLAWLAGPGHAQTASAAADPHVRELAQAIVAADGDRARLSKLDAVEPIITNQIAKALDLADPAKKDRIAAVVHARIQALGDAVIEAKVSATAQTYTVEELEGALAFERSPTGQALRRADPELARGLGSAPAADGPPLPDQKLALINRILKARDVETSARKGWRVFDALSASAVSGGGARTASTAAPAGDPREDAYVKRVLAAEAQFYANTYSDAQLTELAAYFDGPIGRAFTERAPQVASAGVSAARKVVEQQFARLDEDACAAAACNASQRASLDALLGQIQSMLAVGMTALAH